MAQRKISVGNIDKVSGEVNIAAGDIIKNIKTIYQRALTAAEEAARTRKLESKLLAQGIGTLTQSLSAQASEGTESDSPYKGLLSYSLNEAEIFYGRNEAKKDLLTCLKQGPLTVLHAESGAGKSSLLQAGIAAQLIANGHLAIHLRPHNTDPIDFIKRMFLPELTQAPALAGASLREFLRQVCAVLGPKVNLYLLLDQFEEFFNLLNKDERQLFLESLADCLNDPSLKVRWVLALRAEALSDLAELESFGITPFKNTYRLNRLSRAEAREAIIEPARRYGVAFEPALIDHILDTLATNDEVIPTHLQLVCSALTDDLLEGKTLTLAYYTDHEGGTEGILRDYLKRRLEDLPAGEQALAWKVLRALITADRQRAVKTYDEIIQELKSSGGSKEQIDTILGRLIERRLLFTQPAMTETFELAHDYLVKEIQLDPQEQALKAAQELLDQETRTYQRHRTLLTPERLAVIEPYQNELRFSADAEALLSESRKAVQQEQRVRERRRNITLGISVAVAVVMTLLAVWGFRSSGEASKQAAAANAASTEAVAQQATAQAASKLAGEQAEEAQKQTNIAIARQISAQAQALFTTENSKQQAAVLLAIQSMRLFPVDDATKILQNNMLAKPIAQLMHDDLVGSATFSPDGKYVVSGGDDYTARVWEAETGKELVRMTHADRVSSVAFSPDGKYLVSGSYDGTARVWESATGREIAQVKYDYEVYTVVFSQDGKFVASGGCDQQNSQFICTQGSARVWEAGTGKEIARMTHAEGVSSVAFSPDGKYVASVGCEQQNYTRVNPSCTQGSARVWEAATGKEIAHMTHESWMSSVAFSPDSQYVVSGSLDGTARVWEAATGIEIARSPNSSSVSSIAFSPDGKYVVSGGCDEEDIHHSCIQGSARVWEAATGEEIGRMIHAEWVNSVAFSPDGRYVVSGSSDGTARLWKAATGEEIARITNDFSVSSVAFSPDGKYVVSTGENIARVWSAEIGKEITRMTHEGGLTSVAFSPDDKYVVSGGCDEEDIHHSCIQGSARMWEAATGEEIARMTYVGGVNSVAFSPNGKYIVSGGCDQHGSSFMCIQGSARVWEAATGKEIAQTNYDHDVYAVVFSPDGKYVASGGCDQLGSGYSPCAQGSARVWEPQTGKEIARMTHDGSVVAVAFSLDGKYVVSGSSDGMARVWEITTGKEIASVTHDESVFSVGFSPDRKYVVSAGGYTASVWEAATGKVVASSYHAALGPSTPVISVALSPDGKYVVSGGADGAAIVLEAATGEQITYITHDADGSEVSVAFSPDGTYVVSASSAGTTRLWESFTGKEIAQMMGDSVHSVTFSPDGKYVASGGADTVRVWVYRPVDLIAESCFRVTHNLTYEEWDQYIGDTLPYQAVCPDLPLDLEYIKAIARDLLSNSDDPNRVRTTLDRVQAELIKVGVAKDPMTESLSIVSSAIVRRLSSEVTAGDREKTLDLFEQARQIQMQISVDDKDALNEICWDGSLNGYEQQVLQYCESAVRVAPSDANIRDSRGLARALTGDYQGAILDFQYFVDNTTLRYLIGQRKEWIEKLKSEINPFTPEVLESLKQPPQMPSEPEPDMTPTPSPLPTAQIAPTTMNTPVPCPILTLAPSSALTNINTASQCELESLPGIGPTIAQKIIEYRTQNGPFQSIEDIINVSGIGPGTFERIKNLITV